MALLNVAEWIECTEVEGPGRRFALWVQGCILQCPGCCNPHMFDFSPRKLVEADDVAGWIEQARSRSGIEGVTFLGGEPVLQARGLARVAQLIRPLGLSVMLFTGYRLEELPDMGLPGVEELLGLSDLVVDGPFVASRPEPVRNWVGSTNQRFHFLTARYRPGIEYDPRFSRGFEVRIDSSSDLNINGWPLNVLQDQAGSDCQR